MPEYPKDPNPWLGIPACDYEAHMGAPEVDQLAALNRIFAEIYAEVLPQRLLVLGCTTGNGFEHIDPGLTRRVVGIDINPEYLEVAGTRFGRDLPGLELVRECAERCEFEGNAFEMVHAALFFEYMPPGPVLEKIARWLAPGGILAAVLQLPSPEQEAVSPTVVTSIRSLARIMRLLPPDRLREQALLAGLRPVRSWEHPLKSGKRFHVGLFTRER